MWEAECVKAQLRPWCQGDKMHTLSAEHIGDSGSGIPSSTSLGLKPHQEHHFPLPSQLLLGQRSACLLQAPVPFINPQSAFSLDLLAAALPTSVLYWGWGERGWEGTPLPCQLHNPILLALFPLSNLETSLCLPPDPGQSDVQHSITAESPAGQRCS